jgi:superfamily II DNA or RNA helicase
MSVRTSQSNKSEKKSAKAAKLSRIKKPEGMTLEEWQIELRRQFGSAQPYRVKNLGDHPVFSEFLVHNPESRNSYRVRVRGQVLGDNACTCPDFATNTLGTCKHIEFVMAKLGRSRSAAATLKAGHLPSASELLLHYGPQREVRFRPGGECTPELSRLAAQYFDDEGTLREDVIERFEAFLKQGRELDPEILCGDDVLSFIAEVRDASERRRIIGEAFPRGVRSAAFNKLIKVPLYEYQREGALFAAKAGRCLIGDEMGLGKTIQAIAAAEIMAKHLGVERVLIICPTSLKYQWRSEIEKFTTRPSEVIEGLRPQREKGFASIGPFFKIMNYDTVYLDLDLIEKWSPELVILDEAQRIKNWTTRVARSVKKIQSPYAVVLTGTPLENRLEELVSIVQFVDRYRLGPTYRLMHQHQVHDETGKVTGYRDLDQIGKTLEPVLLRRQKDQVLDQLPERIDSTVFVPMTPKQMEHHQENQTLVANVVQRWPRLGFLTEADKRRLMIGLQNMRMACDSTYLLDHATDHGVKADESATLLGEILERRDTKVVIFSQWLRMHELLERRLKKRGWDYVLFHGSVPGKKRGELVDRFRDEPNCRLFLATDAGGVGLNLQFASVVFNLDMPWNPAVLEQRIGRVHRLGQKEPVRVVNFVAKGTIEEMMLSVLQFKKSLFAGVLDGANPNIDFGGSKLNKFMQSVEDMTSKLPASPITTEADQALTEFDGTTREAKQKRVARADEASEERAAGPGDPWSGLLQAGMAMLTRLTPNTASNGSPRIKPLVEKDAQTGESILRLPVPPPEVVEQALTAIARLLESFRK